MSRVAVVGAGMMGTALCYPIADAGHEIRLIGTHLDGEWVHAMAATGIHPRLGVSLPAAVRPFAVEQLEEQLRGIDLLVIGVSSAGISWAAKTLSGKVPTSIPTIFVTKGLEDKGKGELRPLLELYAETFAPNNSAETRLAGIGGPCIAGELARRVPTAVVFTSTNTETARLFQEAFRTPYYHIQTSDDVIGVEVCAALKNAYAMAVGMGAGVHEAKGGIPGPVAQHNFESAIFAQACREMVVLVRALGGNPDCVAGLPGAGDMLVTTSGGRSSRLGRLLGLGHSFADAREQLKGHTLESAEIVEVVGRAIPDLEHRGVHREQLPLMAHLYEVIVQGRTLSMPLENFFR